MSFEPPPTELGFTRGRWAWCHSFRQLLVTAYPSPSTHRVLSIWQNLGGGLWDMPVGGYREDLIDWGGFMLTVGGTLPTAGVSWTVWHGESDLNINVCSSAALCFLTKGSMWPATSVSSHCDFSQNFMDCALNCEQKQTLFPISCFCQSILT